MGFEGKVFEFVIAEGEAVEEGEGFAGPFWVVEFIEGDDGPFAHAREEGFDCRNGRLVDVEVEIEEGDQDVAVGLEKVGDGLHGVALDKMDLLLVPEEPGPVEGLDALGDFGKGVVFGREVTNASDGPVAHGVLGGDGGEARERVEPVNFAEKVIGFECLGKFGPGENAGALIDTAFDDRALDVENTLEEFVLNHKAGEFIPADVFGEVEPILIGLGELFGLFH